MRRLACAVSLWACAGQPVEPQSRTAPAANAPVPAASARLAPASSATPLAVSSTGDDAAPAAMPSAKPNVVSADAEGAGREPNHAPRLCEVVSDGLTVLRACTGAPGETPSPPPDARPNGKHRDCLVVSDGLEIVRPCQGTPDERPAGRAKPAGPVPKLCKVVEGTLVRLAACPKSR